jgi:hypothetical protein
MKKGMARRVKLVVLEYILAGIMHKTLVSPSATKKMTAVKPMATAMGSPIMIKNIKTPKMANVIMVFSLYFHVYIINESPSPLYQSRYDSQLRGRGIWKLFSMKYCPYFFLAAST